MTSLLRIISRITGTSYKKLYILYNRLRNPIIFRDLRIYTSCDIAKNLPETTILPHPVGIVIHSETEVGENVEIRQNVTIGTRHGNNPNGVATIEDDVTIYTGATILGDVTLHEGSIVGANSVVLDDVEPGETVVGAPATTVDK